MKYFTTTKNYQNAKVKVCRTTTTGTVGFYANGYELRRTGDFCDPPVTSTQPLTGGGTACIQQITALYSINCAGYGTVGGVYQCTLCTGTTPHLVQLQPVAGISTVFFGCAQMMIPGGSAYKESAVANLIDSAGKTYLVPTACSPTTANTDKVAIPSFAASPKDESAVACRTDLANVAVWEIVNGVYQVATCDASYARVTVVNSGENYACTATATP